jgi:hypothetical protein
MSIGSPVIIIYGVNVLLGALLYLDVVRQKRNGWWLLAFWLLTYPALIAYVYTRRARVPESASTLRARR